MSPVSCNHRHLLLGAWRTSAVLAVVTFLAACTQAPPAQRPREGAQPAVVQPGFGATLTKLEGFAPPTLGIAAGLLPTPTFTPTTEPTPAPPSPSPRVAVAGASPNASPGLSPIISGLQPAPGSNLPAGDVVISARVTGSSDIVDVTAFVDGEEIPLDLGAGTIRARTVSFVRTFISGIHEIRISARDERGLVGAYRWQFSVGGRANSSAPAIRPATATPFAPQFTPIPIPTRRPLGTSAVPAAAPPSGSPTP